MSNRILDIPRTPALPMLEEWYTPTCMSLAGFLRETRLLLNSLNSLSRCSNRIKSRNQPGTNRLALLMHLLQ